MKVVITIIVAAFITSSAISQHKTLAFSGGYAFATIKDVEPTANGWRIKGQLEHHPKVSKFHHGFTIGYSRVYTEYTEIDGSEVVESKFEIGTFPFYYSPKYMIGDSDFQGFISGSFGFQFSNLKRTGTLPDFDDHDAGVYAGLGAGFRKTFSTLSYIQVEYEWANLSNSYYNDGFMHSASVGYGFLLK